MGSDLIEFIKQARMVRRIEEKVGTNNYTLLGDFLNATVADVEKNNINPGLQKRRALLKKYSLIMRSIKDKLNEMLLREDRNLIAKECFNFLEHRISLDLMGWSDIDIFKH